MVRVMKVKLGCAMVEVVKCRNLRSFGHQERKGESEMTKKDIQE